LVDSALPLRDNNSVGLQVLRAFKRMEPRFSLVRFSRTILVVCLLFPVCMEAASAIAEPDSWPMFRGHPGLTGISPAALPNNLSLLWSYKTAGPVKSSAAIVEGKVFIGSDDMQLHCIDLKSGKKVWSFPTKGEIESSPLVLDKVVYVGSADGLLYAIDAGTGKELWNYKTDDKILGAPNWVESPDRKSTWILAGSYDFKLYCFDSKSGKTNWTFETGNYINGSPAVAEGKTIFGGCDALLHVISLKDGQKIKEIEAGAYIAGSGAFEKNRFYIGHYDNEFICADIAEGNIAWRYKDRAFPYFSSPALTRDRVVFGGRDKKLHCVEKTTGKELWSFLTRGKVDSSPVICGDKIVVGSDDGRLYMVNLTDGKEVWSYDIGQALTSSPAIVNGTVVIGSQDGNVYAFGTKTK
jgi:outer membrane protein assembly factor BamB